MKYVAILKNDRFAEPMHVFQGGKGQIILVMVGSTMMMGPFAFANSYAAECGGNVAAAELYGAADKADRAWGKSCREGAEQVRNGAVLTPGEFVVPVVMSLSGIPSA